MKQYKDTLSDELCQSAYDFAVGVVTGKRTSNEHVDIWTNYAWEEYLIEDSTAVICMKLPKELTDSIQSRLEDLKLFNPDTDASFSDGSGCMAFVWTKGSYIGKHSDGPDRKTITLYLNKEWSIDDGGVFHWFDNSLKEWKTIVPSYNTAVVNTGGFEHFTTPVKNKKDFRVSIQIFILKKDMV